MKKIVWSIFLLFIITSSLFTKPILVKAESDTIMVIEQPQTQITIPGLKFSNPDDVKKMITKEAGGTYLYIPYLGEYIAAIYKYAIVIASIIATFIIMWNGFDWLFSIMSADAVQNAKKRIGEALVGLLIALISYSLLYLINPNLVEFKNLKIKYVEGINVPNYSEGEAYSIRGIDSTMLNGKNITAEDKCLIDNFHLEVGKMAPKTKIKILGIRNVYVNQYSLNAWQKVSDEILASNDPELKGYIQYMKDVNDLKIKDLSGTLAKGPATGAAAQDGMFAPVGISRHNNSSLKHLTYDMHVNGLALDFMAPENWDINWENSTKGKPALPYCQVYKNNFERMKKELPDDPYKMYARLEKNIKDCFNKFDNGNNPFTTLPKEFINIFERNGFYWGGWGWGHKLRTDAMHFEYLGPCGKAKSGATLPEDSTQIFDPGQCDPSSQTCT
jgi:hypothetical protein